MILTIIGVIILILALILLLILFTPFHIFFHLKKRETDMEGYFQVKWLRIRLFKRSIPEEKEEEEEEKKGKTNIGDVLNVLRKFMAAFDYLTPILRAFIKSLEFKKLSLDLKLGFTSPVTTALVSGYFWSMIPILNLKPQINLSLTPDFQENKLDGSVDLEVKLTLYHIVAALLKALTKKPVRELFSAARKLS